MVKKQSQDITIRVLATLTGSGDILLTFFEIDIKYSKHNLQKEHLVNNIKIKS